MKNKIIFVYIFCIVIMFWIFITPSKAYTNLDEIEKYKITIDPKNDGTLDMNYEIKWKVLDSTLEGPLSFVQIGIPNEKIENLESTSDTIKKIKYKSVNGGDYVEIYFDRDYYEGEVITFSFKFNQSYMYNLENGLCKYSFTPGWFDDIEVKNLEIRWNSNKVKNTSFKNKEGGYYIYRTSLREGGKVTVNVQYNQKDLNVSSNKQASSLKNSKELTAGLTTFIIFIFIIIVFFICIAMSGGYYSHRGFYGGYYSHHHYHHSHNDSFGGSSSSSSCACASCACACACAGGGRAGCSKKDFYGTKLSTKKIEKVLKKQK